jgi:hypothetical protein
MLSNRTEVKYGSRVFKIGDEIMFPINGKYHFATIIGIHEDGIFFTLILDVVLRKGANNQTLKKITAELQIYKQ